MTAIKKSAKPQVIRIMGFLPSLGVAYWQLHFGGLGL